MLRSLFRVSSKAFAPRIATFKPQLVWSVNYGMAKKSKKEQDAEQKQKQKNKVREELGGDVKEVDMNVYEEKYDAVVNHLKDQLATVRVGRLDPNSIGSIDIKLGHESFQLNSLAQVTAKGANSCSVTPFDSTQTEHIQRVLRQNNDSLDIKRLEHTLILTQISQGKEIREKLIQKAKKYVTDRREDLRKERSHTLEDLKKLKKIIQKDRLKVMEDEAKELFDKRNKQLDQLQKEKEKELMK